jgi:uncharacterized protein with von Willebrand factor type A (vWA) domain
MFVDFFYTLRAHGLKVTPTEWMTLMQALATGLVAADLHRLYSVGRAILVKNEALFDRYDMAFAEYFDGVDRQFDVSDELLKWLQDPKLPRELTDEEKEIIMSTVRLFVAGVKSKHSGRQHHW